MPCNNERWARRLPESACDCHMHIIESPESFPLAPDRGYEPPIARLNNYRQFQQQAGLSRAILVQPSVYGFDNRLLLKTLGIHPTCIRGVAVPSPNAGARQLRILHSAGVRGVRINALNTGGLGLRAVKPWGLVMRELHWHIQLQIDVTTMADTLHQAAATELPVVVDHFGYPSGGLNPRAPGIRDLLALLAEGRCWIKFSGAYRISATGYPYTDLEALVQRCLAANPARVLWGSDWPHTETDPPGPNTLDELQVLRQWIPNTSILTRVLVDNPAELYDFPIDGA